MINKFEYTLDDEGNKKVEKTNTGIRTYGYDDIYQLTSAKYERNQEFTWEYDEAGNRLSSVEALAPTPSRSYVPNNLNQYASVNGVRYSYDADGNLLTDGGRSFGWDVRNRLTQVVMNSKVVNYNYDHNDLRVEKEVDGRKIKYYYDGSLLLAEKDGNGNILKIYINDGEGIVSIVRPIYNESNTLTHHQRLYYMYDSLGSVSVVAGENGLPLQNYTYSPYGSTMNVEYDTINGLRFVGRYGGYKDDDIGLTYFILRWYNTDNGNFISRDKLNMGAINYRISSIYILYFVKKINIILNSLVDIRELNYRDLLGNERKMFVNKRINNYFSINYRMNNVMLPISQSEFNRE